MPRLEIISVRCDGCNKLVFYRNDFIEYGRVEVNLGHSVKEASTEKDTKYFCGKCTFEKKEAL